MHSELSSKIHFLQRHGHINALPLLHEFINFGGSEVQHRICCKDLHELHNLVTVTTSCMWVPGPNYLKTVTVASRLYTPPFCILL